MKKNKIEDLINQVFNHLTILSEVEPYIQKSNGVKHTKVLCRCICGKNHEVVLSRLKNGSIKSCGCYRNSKTKEQMTTHGMKNTPTYKSWLSMKTRCLNKNSDKYSTYGGKGITIFPDWVESFEKFFDYIGERPEGTTLDRIDNNGNYEPGNVRWATFKEQVNNRNVTKRYLYKDELLTIEELSEKYKVDAFLLASRIRDLKWSVEDAIEKTKQVERTYTYKGETKILKDFAIQYNIDYKKLRNRIYKGKSIEYSIESLLLKNNNN